MERKDCVQQNHMDFSVWPLQNAQVLWSMAKLCWKSPVKGELSSLKVPTEPSRSPLCFSPENLCDQTHTVECLLFKVC